MSSSFSHHYSPQPRFWLTGVSGTRISVVYKKVVKKVDYVLNVVPLLEKFWEICSVIDPFVIQTY